ncbi:flavin reductase family protein [Cohnella thailandensis]|nr:flavin reductase family protein [Cohnella thailandensis]MBP1973177.1 flavin reductase (DIM6/NTAB) family NADH-FMN oxidoreductase RutF [Cohnella thailandensis]
MSQITHQVIKPKVLYYGTPVIILSTLNEDGSTNISPLSSSWALGNCLVLGLGLEGKAIENLKNRPECVVNVPSSDLWTRVEALAPLTGKNPVPEYKLQNSFRYEKDKFTAAGFTSQGSEHVQPDRILECPLQIECEARNIRIPEHNPSFAIVEAEAVVVHAHENIVINENHVNTKEWNPLIYNFRHYFGLGQELGKTFRA